MPIKIVANCTTGEVSEVELTEEEILQMEKDAAEAAEFKAAQEAYNQVRNSARSSAVSKLTALGLTEEEISALLNL